MMWFSGFDQPRSHRLHLLVLAGLAWSANPLLEAAPLQPTSRPTTGPADGRTVELAPGVHIDWAKPQVEVAARVVLREGLLELLACSPQTREHESILRVEARPLHIFQALGLIGLEAGSPAGYDPTTERVVPARGHPINLEVRYEVNGKPRTDNVWDWLINAETKKPPSPRPWIFCGSRQFPGGAFGADVDGTVVCVVDFDTALISLPESHSADNALLWVTANTERIPPMGTECTLLFRAAENGPVIVECGPADRYRFEGQWLDQAGLLKAMTERHHGVEDLDVLIRESPDAPAGSGKPILEAIRKLGVGKVRLQPKPATTAPSGIP
ncbi:MAG: hypothetical protein GY778_24965 [bacterium]|nr:hypothetical protein [bacterium]